MKVKNNSNPFGVKQVMKKAWAFYETLCEACDITPVQTDGIRPKSAKFSLHEKGFAIDLRLRELPTKQGRAFRAAMEKYLGNDYDVLYYEETKHLHVEYQRYLDDKKQWPLKSADVQFVD